MRRQFLIAAAMLLSISEVLTLSACTKQESETGISDVKEETSDSAGDEVSFSETTDIEEHSLDNQRQEGETNLTQDISEAEPSDEGDETQPPETETEEIVIKQAGDFNEGLAWIHYSVGDNGYYGCINQTGELLCYLADDGISNITDFDNGYSYVMGNGLLAIIDDDCNVTYKKDTSSITYDKLVAYGGGFFVTEESYSDFDEAYTNYVIYNPYGEEVETVRKEDDTFLAYCGGKDHIYVVGTVKYGLLGFTSYSLYKYSVVGSSLSYAGAIWAYYDYPSYSDDGMAVLQIDTEDDETKFIVDGGRELFDEITITVPDEYSYGIREFSDFPIINEGKMIIQGSQLVVYDLNTEEFLALDEYYYDKILWDELDNEELYFEDNRIVLPMKGSDGERYYCIFDSAWNVIQEPTKFTGDITGYSCERLILNDGVNIGVYDADADLVFTLDASEVSTSSSYEGYILSVYDKKQGAYYYLDQDGELLFDELDMTYAIKLSISKNDSVIPGVYVNGSNIVDTRDWSNLIKVKDEVVVDGAASRRIGAFSQTRGVLNASAADSLDSLYALFDWEKYLVPGSVITIYYGADSSVYSTDDEETPVWLVMAGDEVSWMRIGCAWGSDDASTWGTVNESHNMVQITYEQLNKAISEQVEGDFDYSSWFVLQCESSVEFSITAVTIGIADEE